MVNSMDTATITRRLYAAGGGEGGGGALIARPLIGCSRCSSSGDIFPPTTDSPTCCWLRKDEQLDGSVYRGHERREAADDAT